MIGSFGSTDTRFKGPKDALPGPGACPSHVWNKALNVNSRGPHRNSQQWTWGTGAGHNLILAGGESPGPGAYGSGQNLDGDILTDSPKAAWHLHPLRLWVECTNRARQQPCALRNRGARTGPVQCGGEHILPIERAHGHADALRRAGAHHDRCAPPARCGHQGKLGLCLEAPSAHPVVRLVGCGDEHAARRAEPARYALVDQHDRLRAPRTDGAPLPAQRRWHTHLIRLDCAALPESNATSAVSLGPGAHTVSRWTGETPNARRIRHAPPGSSAAKTGFLVSAERFAPPGDRGQRGAGDTVMQYLASSSAGPVGQPVHAQSALAQVTRAR